MPFPYPPLVQSCPNPLTPSFSHLFCPALCLKREVKFADTSMTPCELEQMGGLGVGSEVFFPSSALSPQLSLRAPQHISSARSVSFPSSSSHEVLLTQFPFFISSAPGEKYLPFCNWCLTILVSFLNPAFISLSHLFIKVSSPEPFKVNFVGVPRTANDSWSLT